MFVNDLYKNTEVNSFGMQQIWQKIAVFEHKPFYGGVWKQIGLLELFSDKIESRILLLLPYFCNETKRIIL